ncbi:MAG: hypothetical protein KKB20_15210 [Proteobacteria bacterium]|nr:hypothetical protein [Pseudomonadota bacterium]
MYLDRLSKHDIKELVVRNWMTHDGMWFMHCLQEVGIEKTNRINKAAGRSLAGIEFKRVMKAFNLGPVTDMETFKEALEAGWSVLGGDFMDFGFRFEGDNGFHAEARRCFAIEGMKRLGVADQYECGVFSRMEGWFETMGIRYSVSPKVTGCMMVTKGRCYRDYRFEFGD